jgi:hypothetical protein
MRFQIYKEVSPILTIGELIREIVSNFVDLSHRSYAFMAEDHVVEDRLRRFSLLYLTPPPLVSLVPAKLRFSIAIGDQSFYYTIDRQSTITDVFRGLQQQFQFQGDIEITFGTAPIPPKFPLDSVHGLELIGLTLH